MKFVPTQLKYQRVEAEIRELIRAMPVGTRLPSESDFATTCNCSSLTVRKALKTMVDDGTIVRRVGSGTFIARSAGTENFGNGNGGSKRVGVLVYEKSNAYGDRVLQSLTRASLEERVHLQSAWVQSFGDEAIVQANQFHKDGCVALTLPWFPHEMADEVRTFVARCPLPVSLPLLIPGLERNCFVRPELFGADHIIEDIYQYLYSLGHRRIALIGPNLANDLVLQKRVTDFVRFTSDRNLPSPCGLVSTGAQAMDQLAERWKCYRGNLAIVSYDDEHALRFMTAMHKLGLKAPDDFCIIGYNDTEASRYSDPPLSTIHQRFTHVGRGLLKSALALSMGEICQCSEVAPLKLVVRSTCGGRDKVDDSFRTLFHALDITVDNGDCAYQSESAATSTPDLPQMSANRSGLHDMPLLPTQKILPAGELLPKRIPEKI